MLLHALESHTGWRAFGALGIKDDGMTRAQGKERRSREERCRPAHREEKVQEELVVITRQA